jgi:hypothetical protein
VARPPSADGGDCDLSSNLANQTNEEKTLFKTFLDTDPDFSGEAIAEWRLAEIGCDPPDVVCDTVDGRRSCLQRRIVAIPPRAPFDCCGRPAYGSPSSLKALTPCPWRSGRSGEWQKAKSRNAGSVLRRSARHQIARTVDDRIRPSRVNTGMPYR